MGSKQKILAKLVEQNGWEIHIEEADARTWWASEVWLLKDRRSPSKAEARLTFLIDPMIHRSEVNSDSVWGIGLAQNQASNRVEAEALGTISLSKSFKREIEPFLALINSLRS